MPLTGDPDAPYYITDRIVQIRIDRYQTRINQLEVAIREHRNQKADDRCWEDDQRLYEVLGDSLKADNRVGDKFAMLRNCTRFIENRCADGHWPTYTELETQIELLLRRVELAEQRLQGAHKVWEISNKFQEKTIADLKRKLLQEQMGHDTHSSINHEFVIRRVYNKEYRTLVPDIDSGCGFVTKDDGNWGQDHCGRPPSEHPMVVRNYKDGVVNE